LTSRKKLLPDGAGGSFIAGITKEALLCPPEEKAEREAANTLAQLDYIAHLVVRMGVTELRESHVLELQKLAIEGIYGCGGELRTAQKDAELEGGGVVHVPPPPAAVRTLLQEAIDRVNDARHDRRSTLYVAAWVLWRINWIHPFRGGNGRTARAVAYLVICMRIHGMIPGVPQLPTHIARRTTEYVRALRIADRAASKDRENIRQMEKLLMHALTDQLQQALRQYKRVTVNQKPRRRRARQAKASQRAMRAR
jgi:Fic family protein